MCFERVHVLANCIPNPAAHSPPNRCPVLAWSAYCTLFCKVMEKVSGKGQAKKGKQGGANYTKISETMLKICVMIILLRPHAVVL